MSPFKRVLIVQPYGIGDLLFLTPVFRALPDAQIDLLLGSRTESVVKANPRIRQIIRIDKDKFHSQGKWKTFLEIAGLTQRLGKEKYDLMLDYSMRREYGFWAQFFLGIPVRAGFDYKGRGFFLNRKVEVPEGFRGRHVVDYYCDVAEKAGITVSDRSLEFFVTPADLANADNILRAKGVSGRFAAVSAGGGESWGRDAHFKRWPARYFAELLGSLKKEYGFDHAVILGSGAEKSLAEEFQKHSSFPCVSLCGEISLETAAAVLERSVFFAGNDGGLMHMAHALKKPLAAVFGPVDPAVYGPYPAHPRAVVCVKNDLECRPCYQKFRYNSACEHRDCLQKLMPSDVLKILQGAGFQPV